MQLNQSNYRQHQTGDIIIVNHNGPARPSIISTQELLTGKPANSTHIFLCYAPSIFIEATAFKKVDLFLYNDHKRSSTDADCVKILRHKKVTSLNSLRKRLMEASEYHLYKTYNLADLTFNLLSDGVGLINKPARGKEDDQTIFCSELIGAIYKTVINEVDSNIFFGPSIDLYPNLFEDLDLVDSEWDDVSNEYFSGESVKMMNFERDLMQNTIDVVRESVKYKEKNIHNVPIAMGSWLSTINRLNGKLSRLFRLTDKHYALDEIDEMIHVMNDLIGYEKTGESPDNIQINCSRLMIINFLDACIEIIEDCLSKLTCHSLSKSTTLPYHLKISLDKTRLILPLEGLNKFNNYFESIVIEQVNDFILYETFRLFLIKMKLFNDFHQ